MSNQEQDVPLVGDEDSEKNAEYVLRLFVTGASSNSLRAISNVKRICETHLKGNYTLEIVDIYRQTSMAEADQIIALPLLIKTLPLPGRRLIGDMSDTDKVLRGLGLIL